jgi:hypothetical protein
MARGRQRRSWGSNEPAGPGRRRLRYWADMGDGKGYRRVSETVEATRREADSILARRRVEHDADRPAPSVGTMWRSFVWPLLERRAEEGEISPGTLDHYASAWARQVEPRWGNVPAPSVRRADVQEWYDGMTRSQASMARILVRYVFDECELREVCDGSVGRYPYRMPSAGDTRDKGIWSLDELGTIWRASKGTYLEPWLILAAFGGPRVGESMGVRREEVWSWDGGPSPVAVVPIVRQAGRLGDVSDRLKTRWSSHAAVVPGPLGVRLCELCADGGDGWIIPGKTEDVPMHRELLRARFDSLVAEAGVPRHPVRNLRNSWETFTHWTLGVDPEKIERMMGHVGTSVTERHYDRPEAELLAAEISRAYAEHPYADGWVEGATDSRSRT